MFCYHCGKIIDEKDNYCRYCGVKTRKYKEEEKVVLVSENQINKKKFSGFSIAGFVLSLIGLFVAGIPSAILGVIFSSVALKELRTEEKRGKGLAIAGLVISIVAITFYIIMLVIVSVYQFEFLQYYLNY